MLTSFNNGGAKIYLRLENRFLRYKVEATQVWCQLISLLRVIAVNVAVKIRLSPQVHTFLRQYCQAGVAEQGSMNLQTANTLLSSVYMNT